jgi:hypothetical protein
MDLSTALKTHGEYDTGFLTGPDDPLAIRDGIGDGFIQKDVLPCPRRCSGRFQVRAIRGGIDDPVDRRIVEDRLIVWGGRTAILLRKSLPFGFGAAITAHDLQPRRPLDGIGEHV